MKRLHIVAGIVFNQRRDEIFITRRLNTAHKAGFWEFPGGKVEEETAEKALIRELNEEIGINVLELSLFDSFDYDYSDKALYFDFFLVTGFDKVPYGREGQVGKWVEIRQLRHYSFPEANTLLLEKVIKEFSR